MEAKPSSIAVASTFGAGTATASQVEAGAAVAGETADAAGVVAEGAVADSIVELDNAGVAEGTALACAKIFDIRLLNIPIGLKYA